jgi:putative ABC transport system permease protein
LLYGLALAMISGLLFGLAPALQLLRESQTSAMVRSRRRWFQDAFVTAQVAGAFVLVVTTVLLLRSLWAVQQIQTGFDPQHLTTAFFTKPKNDPGFQDRLQAALLASPGVESAALAYPVPFDGGGLTSGFSIRNRQQQPGEPEWHGEAYFVSPQYLRTMRIPLLRGRDISETDTAAAPQVCLIDRRLAERFFPNQEPIGQQIAMYGDWASIVGVVGTVRATTLEEWSRPVVYRPLVQVPFFAQSAAVVRSGLPAVQTIREAVRRTNGSVPVFDVRTMQERIGESLGIRRILAVLLSVFGGISLVLATIGLYGVIAQVVSERTQEIGIRMTLGAQPAQIVTQFARQGLRAGLLGLALGTVASVYTQGWLASSLYHAQSLDLATFAAVASGILLLLLAAVWWPSRRASRVDPLAALRYE